MGFITNEVAVAIPEHFMKFIEDATVLRYTELARTTGMTVNEYITTIGFDSVEALLQDPREREEMTKYARIQLVMQAIAEDLNLLITDTHVNELLFLQGATNIEGVIEASGGMPSVKQGIMHENILGLIIENAIVA
jgi:hypothetical protein